VSAELLRFGIRADDSGGRPLSGTPAARLLRLVAEAAFRPGQPEHLLDLFSHPMLVAGMAPSRARRMGVLAELVLLRTGRADVACLLQDLERRRHALAADRHAPFWLERIGPEAWQELEGFLARIE